MSHSKLSATDTENAALLTVSQPSASTLLLSSPEKMKSCVSVSDILTMPKDLDKCSYLKPLYYVLDNGLVFNDKLLPDPDVQLTPVYQHFTKEYFIDLHFKISLFNTYNHLGARISLEHSRIRVNKFRELLPPRYDDMVILQYMEYGFPLGLKEDFILKPVLKNHSSAYKYYSYVDKFIKSELSKGGM